MSDFDRGTFLLAKQLMYFERYGRMFVSEVPILNDRAFITQLLAGVDMSSLELTGRTWHETGICSSFTPGPAGGPRHGEVTWQRKR